MSAAYLVEIPVDAMARTAMIKRVYGLVLDTLATWAIIAAVLLSIFIKSPLVINLAATRLNSSSPLILLPPTQTIPVQAPKPIAPPVPTKSVTSPPDTLQPVTAPISSHSAQPEKSPTVDKNTKTPSPKEPVSTAEKAPDTAGDRQNKARQKAQTSGLLALSGQVGSLLDTQQTTATMAAAQQKQSAQLETMPDRSVLNQTRSAQIKSEATPTSTELKSAKLASSEINSQQIKSQATAAAAATGGTGDRSNADIARVFSQNKQNLDQVYERARRELPGLQGKVVLELEIDTEGRVTKINLISSDFASPEIEAKIIARVKQFKFAPSTKGTSIRYPIEFAPA